MSERTKLVEASNKACAHCPWRLSNQGNRTPDGWYSGANLRRLWAKLRRGEGMTCHLTDPANPVSERQAKAIGYTVKPNVATHECAGYLTLVQREVMVFTEYCKQEEAGELPKGTALATYLRERSMGLTREGLGETVSRGLFGTAPILGGAVEMAKPNLGDEEIGYAPLEGWQGPVARQCGAG